MKKKILILASIALLAGCNKENSIFSPNGGFKSSVAESSITADDKDPTNYMKLTDYLPSSQNLIYEERIEFLKYAYNESPTYRDRNLNEVMFLYEAGINMDMNHLAIPLNKFKIEQTFVDINIENGKIPAASIKEGFVAIKEHIKAQGLKRRYVGMLDIEPVRIIGNKVRLRAGLYTGEPIEENKIYVDPIYEKPYGDEYFLGLNDKSFGKGCDNRLFPFSNPEANAADDLSGRFYQQGTYGIYAQQNQPAYSFNGTQWIFNTQYTLNLYGVPIAATFDKNPWWQQLYTFVNLHKDNWPIDITYNNFYNNPPTAFGEINFPHIDNTSKLPRTINTSVKNGLEELVGFSMNQRFLIDGLPCTNHESNNYIEHPLSFQKFSTKLFYRKHAFESGAGGKPALSNCIKGCEFNDFVDQFNSHINNYLDKNIFSANYPLKKIVGAEFHPCYFIEYSEIKNLDYNKNEIRDINGICHFIFPSYGDKVTFMKD